MIRDLRVWQDERLRSVETTAGQQIAAARFAVYGRSLSPDANSTPRLGYGRVVGYEEGTTLVPWRTTFYGLYDRAESFAEKPPFDLPERWKRGRSKLDLATPLNFVYTADTIGGNSGSPLVLATPSSSASTSTATSSGCRAGISISRKPKAAARSPCTVPQSSKR